MACCSLWCELTVPHGVVNSAGFGERKASKGCTRPPPRFSFWCFLEELLEILILKKDVSACQTNGPSYNRTYVFWGKLLEIIVGFCLQGC